MTLITFLVVCLAGLFVTLLTAPYPRLGRLAAVVSLGLALAAAVLLYPDDTATIGGVQLQMTPFAEDFLAALAASSLLLCLLGLITGWAERLAPAALAILAGVCVATTSTEPTVALAAAAAATTPAALVASRVRSTPLGPTVGAAELRTLALVVAASLLAALTILNTNWNADDPTFVLALAFVFVAAAVAVRSGVFPFHVPAALLSRSGEGLGLALSLVWVPAGFALVALSWNASIFGVPGSWLDLAVAAVQLVAVATLILGAVGALLHDEVEEVVVYSVVQDAGFILLALTARTEDASAPARLWLASFVVAKSALVGWAAAVSWTFKTSNLGALGGWLRRSPLLGLALAAIVVATLGWPGSTVFEARATLASLGLPAQLGFVGTAAVLLSLLYYTRLAAVGLLAPSEAVRNAESGWLRLPHLPETQLEVETSVEAPKVEPKPAERGPFRVMPLNRAEMPKSAASDEEPERVDAHRPGAMELRRRLVEAWHLNRPLEAGALVLVIAVLAVGIALGGLAVANAATQGIALDQVAGMGPQPSNGDNGGQVEPSESPEAETTASDQAGSASSDSAPPASDASPGVSPSPSPTPVASASGS